MAFLSSSRLVILACSARKRPDAAYLPAIERYDGPLWKTLRAADPTGARLRSRSCRRGWGFVGPARPSRSMTRG